MTEATFWFTAGALVRRDFRRYLQSRRIQFTEEKGWLDSQFVCVSSLDEYEKFVIRFGIDAPTT